MASNVVIDALSAKKKRAKQQTVIPFLVSCGEMCLLLTSAEKGCLEQREAIQCRDASQWSADTRKSLNKDQTRVADLDKTVIYSRSSRGSPHVWRQRFPRIPPFSFVTLILGAK